MLQRICALRLWAEKFRKEFLCLPIVSISEHVNIKRPPVPFLGFREGVAVEGPVVPVLPLGSNIGDLDPRILSG